MRNHIIVAVVLLIIGIVLAEVVVAAPQRRRQIEPPAIDQPRCGPDDRLCREMEYERQKKRNTERQDKLRQDTDELLKLAQELKAAVDKSNENTLSLEVIRKTEEIERLAKSVRTKMRNDGY